MKKLTFLFSIVALFAVTNVQAQAQKSCCASKTASANATCSKDAKAKVASATGDNEMYAAKMASMDENIERQVCPETGAVTYVKSYICEETGKPTTAMVSFDADLGQFVNVAPSSVAKDSKAKACCTGAKEAACCAKDGKAASAKMDEKAEKVKLTKSTSGTK